jgi:hypothetical protein
MRMEAPNPFSVPVERKLAPAADFFPVLRE